MEAYTIQLLNNRLDLTGGKELKEPASVNLPAVEVGRLRESLDCRDTKSGLQSIQRFQEHLNSYLSTLHRY